MNLMRDLKHIIETLNIPVETGVFSNKPPNEYVVITPMTDTFDHFADNKAQVSVSEARLSLFTRGNYIKLKDALTGSLLEHDITITDRQYVGYEEDTKYHHYAIDVMKEYETEG